MEQFSSSSGSSGASSSSSSVGSSSSSSSNQSESEILVSGGDRSAENCCNGSGSSTQMASSAREMQITADKALCDSILDEGVRNCGDSCGNGVISISDHIFNNNAVSATDPHSESCDCWLGEKKQVITGSATVSPQNEDRVGVDPEIALIASIAKSKEDSLLAIRKLRSLQIDKKRKRAKLLKAFKIEYR
uniref:Uncharacterized protein n=1 Tax=Romanomermis culicivorax TaxID=13658 RepID=A0A915HSV2_ROMCU